MEKELDPAEVERRAHREALDVVAELIRRGDVTELDELYRICPNIVDQAIEIYKLAWQTGFGGWYFEIFAEISLEVT